MGCRYLPPVGWAGAQDSYALRPGYPRAHGRYSSPSCPYVCMYVCLPSKILAPAAHERARHAAHACSTERQSAKRSVPAAMRRPLGVSVSEGSTGTAACEEDASISGQGSSRPTTAPLSPPCLHCTCRIGTGTAANTSLNGVNAANSRWSALAAVDSAPRSRHLRKRPTPPRRFLRFIRPRQRLFLCPIRRR